MGLIDLGIFLKDKWGSTRIRANEKTPFYSLIIEIPFQLDTQAREAENKLYERVTEIEKILKEKGSLKK